MSRFWSPLIESLEPYVPGEQPTSSHAIKLNTNENPYGPSPQVLAAIKAGVSDTLRLYPDPDATMLKQAIANHYKVGMEQIFVGNGSDEVLAHIFQALFQQSLPLLFPDITYSFYAVYCSLYQIDYRTMALNDKFEIDIDDYLCANGGIIFANPNAPTGCLLPLNNIERLLRHNTESVVVIDEAYIDFGGCSAIDLIDSYDNLLVTQTLSKSRSLAGMRIGFAVGHADLITALVRVKDSFNSYPISSLAMNAGIAAFLDQTYFDETCQKIIDSRDDVVRELISMGFEVLPSKANFIFTRHPQYDARDLLMDLRQQGVIVRHFDRDRISQYLRITIGREEENQRLLAAMDILID